MFSRPHGEKIILLDFLGSSTQIEGKQNTISTVGYTTPHSQTKWLVLFLTFLRYYYSHLDKDWASPSPTSMACIKWSQPILTSFGWVAIPAVHFSQRSLSGSPIIDPIFSPSPNHTLWKPWPVTHLPCIGWVQIGGALALCACSTLSEFVSF